MVMGLIRKVCVKLLNGTSSSRGDLVLMEFHF